MSLGNRPFYNLNMNFYDDATNKALVFPPVKERPESYVPDTLPMPLHDLPEPHQVEVALEVVRQKYPRVANTIRIFWGFPEGADYLTKLIFDGCDPKSHTREGFKSDVLNALLTLQSLHRVNK